MEFFALPLVASLLGSGIAAASSNGEACSQASSRSGELLKFIPLCILQYPPFFLPLSKQQASRHLGYFKFVPPRSTPLPLPSRFTRTRTHVETTLKGNGSMFCFVLFFPQVLPKLILGFFFLYVCFFFVVVKIKCRTASWLWL